ncbi:phosphate acyltransferase PlsX [Mycoplasmoides gallisepticum]|uniref:phosphate acyltransferase PlsX n=1 Tax=Mycoplasmoides gallisepticum TaxID=2096 RepID=UPI0009BF6A93|nr:phosphate acyltransferase PlsX [Mycoplasmoides gallisepticum]QEX46733.1 phosphate acyltransferase PlsX [Mycoplasmoides gallisepticum]QEX47420.1 phosphate acyltransferase PlsX [Mycoplasmoides gallisepticum]WVH33512.1 phosphate acyltransferase PlsX [Mycoplasmoides gallisepticum]WVH34232.1 phosphate acyltransferase PlsX [Mycoplasmoides gallisepticum]WVH34986.1 phosphate acyltransferase PlsX [Mycoplasmoides gallisepticum]
MWSDQRITKTISILHRCAIMFRIAVDCMGFENSVSEAVKAVIKYAKKHKDLSFVLVGDENQIRPLVENKKYLNYRIVHTTNEIGMSDSVLTAYRKKDSSMYLTIELLKNNEVDTIISAGSSSAYVALTYNLIGKIHHKIKVGFMSYVPTVTKRGFWFLDVGANKEYLGEELYYLGKMANTFITSVFNYQPRLGVLNIGAEKNKGFEYHQVVYNLLENDKTVDFLGFIEPRGLIEGECDLLVSDGYSGNLVLKSLEGALKSVGKILKKNYKINPLGALFSANVIYQITKTFDYKNNAGAVVLGLNKLVLKTHGSADAKQFYSTIRLAHESLLNNLIEKITKECSTFLN